MNCLTRKHVATTWALVWTVVAAAVTSTAAVADELALIQYGPAKQLASLDSRQIRESSGLACSRRVENLFWTHNDSGDSARIFAFGASGEDLGSLAVVGAKARDWEDMASMILDGVPCLLLADVGDNSSKRNSYTLYLMEEPRLDKNSHATAGPVRLLQTVRFRYDDGAHNCESVAFDAKTKMVLLVTKSLFGAGCKVYSFAWPKSQTTDASPAGTKVIAKVIAKLNVPLATAMDISADGRRAIVVTYGPAYEFTRREGESWAKAFARGGRRLNMPLRTQGESICYGTDGKTLYLTSERWPTPLWRISPK